MYSHKYDYEHALQRLRKARKMREARNAPPPGPARLRANPAASPRSPQPRASLASRLRDTIRDESKQLAAASLVLLGFVGWLGSWAMGLYARHNAEQLASACHSNSLGYAGEVYCYDNRRFVHTLTEDGAAKKPGLDWRVNEAALKKAESQARVAAREEQAAREAQ
jgi:hypothetical protein